MQPRTHRGTTGMGLDLIERTVRHAMQDMDRNGIHPSGDRLCEQLQDYPEGVLRHTRMHLVAGGHVTINTPPDNAWPESDGDPLEGLSEGVARDTLKLRKREIASSKDNNIAICRIMDGKGSLLESLATLTGLSPNAVKMRARQARIKFPDEIDDGRPDELSPEDRRYLQKHYKNRHECQDFLSRIHTAHRRNPDTRTAV